MNITKVNVTGLVELCKSVYEVSQSDIFKSRKFETHLNRILDNVYFSFDIENISEYEYIILKGISTTVTPFIRDEEISLSFVADNFMLAYTEVKNTVVLLNEMKSNMKEIHNMDLDFSRVYLPSGCITGKCKAIFNGVNLIPLIEGNLISFLIKNLGNEIIDESGNLKEVKYFSISEEIETNLMTSFVQFFYKSLCSDIFSSDIISDYIVSNTYDKYFNRKPEGTYKIYENKGVSCTDIKVVDLSVSDTEFVVEIGGEEYKHTDVSVEIKNKKYQSSMSEIKLKFLVQSSFASYFDLVNLLPKKCIKDMDTMQYLHKIEHNVPFHPLVKNFNARIKSHNINLNRSLGDMEIIRRNELLMNYSKIRYTVDISLQDVNDYLGKFNSNSSDVVNTTDTRFLVNTILNAAYIVYNIAFKK